MFGWLTKKIQEPTIRSQEKALSHFVESLKDVSGDELASLLVVATKQRLFFPKMGVQLTEYLDGASPKGCDQYPLKVASAVKEMQKVKDFAAAGTLLVWVHSTRAVAATALRPYGEQMWAELKRGFPSVVTIWENLDQAGFPLETVSVDDCLYVPSLLDPEPEDHSHL